MRAPPHHQFPIPYRIDFTEENKGRHLDATKRKITWKFGFVHPPSVFPHLYDGDEYTGYRVESVGRWGGEKSVGVECRGREHEIVLVWSLVSGKAHLYVDNKELYRHTPPSDEIFNPFTAQFHKGFNLPNSKYNGHHRLDIRCYSRIPLGAKNMSVNEHGGKFHQYELTVDGLSFFAMPAMWELNTETMWRKIDAWGMIRMESRASGENCTSEEEEHANRESLKEAYAKNLTETYDRWNEIHEVGGKQRSGSGYNDIYGRTISKHERKAIIPRDENEEERMIRIAMEASMRDLNSRNTNASSAPYYSNGNGHKHVSRQKSEPNTTSRLAAVGEDENLIDFGEDSVHDLSRGVSQIAFPQQMPSDVSVLGDDDATVASFMVPMQQPGGFAQQQQQQYQSYNPAQQYQRQSYQQAPPIQTGFQDPTFNPSFASPTTPRTNTFNDSASFAYAPPPTWDDYKDAFGGSVRMDMTASVVGGSTVMSNSMMSPMSASSPVNSAAFVSQQQPQQHQQQQQYPQQSFNGSMSNVYAAHPFASPVHSSNQQNTALNTGKNSMFDPLRSDPFAS